MDFKQPNIRSALTRRAPALSVMLLLNLAMLACLVSGQVEPEEVDRAVAATLTTVAQQANPTNAQPTAQSTQAPAQPSQTQPPPSPEPATQAASATNVPPATATNDSGSGEEGGVPGTISGGLSYPSEQIPQLAVVFFNLDDNSWWWVGTAVNQSSYQMTVPVGNYHVVAYAGGGLAGGYTAAVPCGLTAGCTDHSLLTVHVGSNEQVTGINATDWYAPQGTFPAKPAGINYP
jgi:hypothetical protein